jgi:hypothetical protein
MQLRYATGLSIEEYVRTRAWEKARLDACPFHPNGGCGFSRHGCYLRKFPVAAWIPRWYCPQERETIGLLPDFFASRLPGTLDEVEQAVNVAEDCCNLETAAEILRPEIALPGGLRWLRRRIHHVRDLLTTVAGLILPGCPPTLDSFRQALATGRVLIRLRKKAAPYLQSLPRILGFGPRRNSRWSTKMHFQQSMGPD